MKRTIPCPCGNPAHPPVKVYDPDTLHPELADFVSDVAGFTYGSAHAEPEGAKGQIYVIHMTNPSGGPCAVWDSVFDGEFWRNTYRWSAADEAHAEELRASLGPSALEDIR